MAMFVDPRADASAPSGAPERRRPKPPALPAGADEEVVVWTEE